MKLTAQGLVDELHSIWKPHPGQRPPRQSLFREGAKDIFIEAGRNWGKTEFVSYVLWRFAILNPGSENYYFAPFMKQAREILWASRRMQTLGPAHWIESINDSQLRLTFKNKSFIKLDGSDNVEAYRGVKPKGLTVFDEFKDFRPEFYEAYDPNRAAHDSSLIIIGTPPETDCQFTEVADFFKTQPNKKYFHAPSEQNPYLSREWLNAKREELYARGEGDVWEREYMAKRVRGGKRSIFPMFDIKAHTASHEEIEQTIARQKWDMDWVVSVDPATVSTFGGLVACQNPYSRKLYIMAELYESTQSNTSVTQIVPRIEELKRKSFPYDLSMAERWEERWLQVCDEAEAWFINEALDRFQQSFQKTSKATNDKEYGISLIRDLMLHKKIIISKECPNLIRELENYVKGDNGKIAKINDHLIDCLRYMLHALHYTLNESAPFEETLPEDPRQSRMVKEARDWADEEESIDSNLVNEYF